jgi:NTP pyrophosphatase (non-canonical NTP hydrolase)
MRGYVPSTDTHYGGNNLELARVRYYEAMQFDDMQKAAIRIRQRYDAFNASRGVEWDVQNFMAGFVGDVGDLSKLLMAKQGLRDIPDLEEKIAHELADCLWSIIIIADKCRVDLPREFQKTMDELEKRIQSDSSTY